MDSRNGARSGPEPRHVGSWQAAEHNAAAWMRYWGFTDAKAQPGGPDGGIDVRATGALGQVKNRPTLVGRPDIQRLLGAAIDHPRARLLFFSAGGFSTTAIEEANRRGVALFTYVLDGTMTAVNSHARGVMQATQPTQTSQITQAQAQARVEVREQPRSDDWGSRATAWRRQQRTEWEKSQERAERQMAFVGRNWRLLLAALVLLFATVNLFANDDLFTDDPVADAVLLAFLYALGVLLIRRHIMKIRRNKR